MFFIKIDRELGTKHQTDGIEEVNILVNMPSLSQTHSHFAPALFNCLQFFVCDLRHYLPLPSFSLLSAFT
jgi:hypothetical protein